MYIQKNSSWQEYMVDVFQVFSTAVVSFCGLLKFFSLLRLLHLVFPVVQHSGINDYWSVLFINHKLVILSSRKSLLLLKETSSCGRNVCSPVYKLLFNFLY